MLFLYFWLSLGALAAISFLLLSKRRTRAVKWMALFALLGGAGSSLLYVILILRQTASTAAIGIIFVPKPYQEGQATPRDIEPSFCQSPCTVI